MRIIIAFALSIIAAGLSAGDVVQIIPITPTANEQGLVPAQVMFTRSGSGQALTVQYRITGSAHADIHKGSVAQLLLTSSGSGYVESVIPLVFSGGTQTAPQRTPEGDALGDGGYVSSVTVINGGAGYTSQPTVTISGTGAGATATAVMTGYVTGVNISAGGSGYNVGDPVQLSGGGGSGAAATVLSIGPGGSITGITINSGGSGYTTAPTVGFSGGADAAGVATIANRISEITVTSGGVGYTSASVLITGGGGSGASAIPLLYGRSIDGLDLVEPGYGYVMPTITVGGSGGAVLRPVFNDGTLVHLAIEESGSGYAIAPSITIDPPTAGVQATATSTIDASGRVNGYVITNAGSGYGPTAALNPSFPALRTALTTYALGAHVLNGSRVYVCVVAGTTGGGAGPVGTNPAVTETDGSCTWQYRYTLSIATTDVILAGPDYVVADSVSPITPSGTVSIDPATGELIGTITFSSSEVAKYLYLVPRRNGVGGARTAVVSIDPSADGDYIVNQQSSASTAIADADIQAELRVPLPVAYPTPPSQSDPNLPLEVQGRGEWHISLNDSDLFKAVAVELGSDASVGPEAELDSEYILATNNYSLPETADHYVVVTPLDPAASPMPAAPSVGDTVIPVSSVGLFSGAGDEVVIFENPSSVLSGIYTVTGFDAGAPPLSPTITIEPGLRVIATSYGQTRVRRLGKRIYSPGAGNSIRDTWYGAFSDLYYFAFPIIDGNSPRGKHSLSLTLLQSDDYRTLSPTSGTVTVADDAVTVGVRLGTNASKPQTNGVFTVVLSTSFPTPVNVPFLILPGSTATLGTGGDFTITGVDVATRIGSVQVPANATSVDIVVLPLTNNDAAAESFTLQLLPSYDYLLTPQGTSAVNPAATMTIAPAPLNSGSQPVYVSISSVSVNENALTASVTVRLTDQAGVTSTDTLVNAAAIGFNLTGNASSGSDYTTPSSLSVSMAAGTNSAVITIPILDDQVVENDESIIVNLTPGPGYILSSVATGTITIVDNEPSFTIAGPASDPIEGGAPASFVITSSRAVDVSTTVSYTIGGTATGGTDYSNLTGSVVIPIGQSSATISVSASTDEESDPDETVTVTLNDDAAVPPTFKLGTTVSASLTITEPPVTSIAIVSITTLITSTSEATGALPGAVRVSAVRSGATNAALVVPLTIGGTALPNGDYTALPVSVTMPELLMSANAPTGAGFLTVQALGGEAVTIPAGARLRVGATATLLTVDEETVVDTTATILGLSGTLTASIPAGVSIGVCTAVALVTPIDDAVAEGTETVTVSLNQTAGANWTEDPVLSTASVSIADDESPGGGDDVDPITPKPPIGSGSSGSGGCGAGGVSALLLLGLAGVAVRRRRR